MEDEETNRFSARAARYARVGANVGGFAARIAGARLLGGGGAPRSHAAALAQALGSLKGPVMKAAQMMATIPGLLPPDYAERLQKLQSEAPPMGAAFVKRRMQAERIGNTCSPERTFPPIALQAHWLGLVRRAEREYAGKYCRKKWGGMLYV